MSVDISRLSAHLSDAQRIAIQAEYERQAKSPTAAFLLCFFLGIFGAHRFYLGQPGAGVLRLILSPLLIPGIIWEIIDLFRIDHEVLAINLRLAEQLVAANTLDAHSPAVAAAVAQLNAIRQEEHRTPGQEPSQASSQAVEASTPVALEATVLTPISDDPGTPATSTIEIHEDAPPIWPVDPELAALSAVAIAGGGLSGSAPQSDSAPASAPDMGADRGADTLDITPEMVAMAAATANAAAPLAPGQAPDTFALDDITVDNPPTPTIIGPDDPTVVARAPIAVAAPEWMAPTPRAVDLTDSGPDTAELPILADPGEATGERVVVRLPNPSATASTSSTLDWTDLPAMPSEPPSAAPDAAPDYAGMMAPRFAEESAPLLLLPIEPDEAPPATAGDGYESDVSEELHDRLTETGSHRIVKRVKVVRRLVINGEVVEEATAEQVVDADADTSTTARNLQESLRGGDIQQRIAALSAPVTPPIAPPTAPSTPTNGDAPNDASDGADGDDAPSPPTGA